MKVKSISSFRQYRRVCGYSPHRCHALPFSTSLALLHTDSYRSQSSSSSWITLHSSSPNHVPASPSPLNLVLSEGEDWASLTTVSLGSQRSLKLSQCTFVVAKDNLCAFVCLICGDAGEMQPCLGTNYCQPPGALFASYFFHFPEGKTVWGRSSNLFRKVFLKPQCKIQKP
jgi:hypothetical protein